MIMITSVNRRWLLATRIRSVPNTLIPILAKTMYWCGTFLEQKCQVLSIPDFVDSVFSNCLGSHY